MVKCIEDRIIRDVRFHVKTGEFQFLVFSGEILAEVFAEVILFQIELIIRMIQFAVPVERMDQLRNRFGLVIDRIQIFILQISAE